MKAHRVDPAFLVVACGVAAAMHVGKLPGALPVLRAQLGLSLVDAGFLLSLVQLAGMLLGLAVGLAADPIGLKRTMVAGLSLLGAASALGALAETPAVLMALRAAEGCGFLLAAMPAPSLIRRLVAGARMNAALGWWGAYMPLGTALALLLGPLAIHFLGWRGWWVVLGVLAVAAGCALAWALPADARAQARPVVWRARLARTLTARGPWLVALAFGVYSAQWLSVIGFLPSLYEQAGVSPAWAGAATALAALVNMVGNVAAGRLLQRGVPAPHLLFAGYAIMAIGGVCAYSKVPPALAYAGVFAFSMVGGLVPGTLFSLAVRLAPAEDAISTTVGWMQQWSAFGQFAGPPLVAWVATFAGGWQWSGAVTACFAAAGAVLAAGMARELRGAVR